MVAIFSTCHDFITFHRKQIMLKVLFNIFITVKSYEQKYRFGLEWHPSFSFYVLLNEWTATRIVCLNKYYSFILYIYDHLSYYILLYGMLYNYAFIMSILFIYLFLWSIFIDLWFWFGSSCWTRWQQKHDIRSCDSILSGTRAFDGSKVLYCCCWHMVCWLYFCRTAGTSYIISSSISCTTG